MEKIGTHCVHVVARRNTNTGCLLGKRRQADAILFIHISYNAYNAITKSESKSIMVVAKIQ